MKVQQWINYQKEEKEQEQLTAELGQLEGKLKSIAAEFALPLAEIERFADTEHQLLRQCRIPAHGGCGFISGLLILRMQDLCKVTDRTCAFAGWVPQDRTGALIGAIHEQSRGRAIVEVAEAESLEPVQEGKVDVPVLFNRPKFLQPFALLTEGFDIPSYTMIDPTIFVAVSFLLMFGMMFGDAGHGMVLAAIGLAALIAGRSKKLKDLGVLLIFGGLSSTIFGVVYGSYFGIEALKQYALWHDPLEGNPIQLMYGAIGIGVIMISLGLILNIINRFRRGDIIGGVLDKFGLVGLLFYWGTLLLLIHGAVIRSWGLMSASIILFLVVPIVGWSLKEPLEHFIRHRTNGGKEANNGLQALLWSHVLVLLKQFSAILQTL